ncbi:MAG: UbiA family prenyltransferase [Flavobacteriales bacterium]|nr:UbiA family prenyltransferase [Flavobacteriales bacterium]
MLSKLAKNLYPIFYAARFFKNLPLLFIFLSGCFLITTPNFAILLLASIAILSSSFFMTHVNVITDYELDKVKKPSFYNALARNRKLSKIVIISEVIIFILALALLVILGYSYTSLFILLFSIVAIAYSYNFFSNKPKEKRLKVYWWGHFLVMMVGYTCLWLSGLSLSPQFITRADLLLWVLLFLCIALSEYGVFLLESSIDYKEESVFKLKSMPSLIGEENTIKLSAFIGLLSILSSAFLILNNNWHVQLYVFAFLPAMLVRCLYEIFIIFVSNKDKRQHLKKYIPDILFIGTRLYTLIVILILMK